jgi:pimeloyl-ACP methyl ester carboxylesterase
MTVIREPDAVHDGAGAGPVQRPSIRLLMSEPARGLADLARLPVAAPWLAFAPRGDGHGVLVLPGLLATDASTAVLRQFLRWLGYDVRGWNLARNLGPTVQVLDELPRALSALAEHTGRPVSLIGWSLGGVYARELARQRPELARQVITLASPFMLTDSRQSHAHGAYQRHAHLHATDGRLPTREQRARPLPVPSTAVYSRRDGVVSWQACIEPETALHQNVEVRCGHLGFGVDPATLWLIADRLAASGDRRRGFQPPPALRPLYPRRHLRRIPPHPAGCRRWRGRPAGTTSQAEEQPRCSNSPALTPRSSLLRRPTPRATSAGCACWIPGTRPSR